MDDRPPKQQKSNNSFLGQILVDRKKISEKQLETALNTQQSKIGQNKLIGDILVNQGAISQADLKDALSTQSLSPDVPADEVERIEKLKGAVLAEPQNVENRWQLAQAYMKVNANPQAVSELQAITRVQPDNLRALQALGKAAGKCDNWELSASAWQKAFGQIQDETNKQGLFEARLKLGELAMAQRNAQGAAQQFQTLLRIEPENPILLYHFALTFKVQEQPASAIKYLQQASKVVLTRPDPIGGKIFIALGEILIDSKKQQEGLQALQQALRFAPKDPQIFVKIGEIYQAMGLLDKAVDAYTQALSADRRQVAAHLALGQILEQRGNRDKAMGHYRSVVEIDPQNALGYCYMGRCLIDAGDKRNAGEYYTHAMRLGMSNPHVQLMVGNYFLEIEKFDDAIERYMKALDLDPRYLEPRINMGAAFHRQGRLDRAMKEYKAALEVSPTHMVALKNLAKIQEERGDVQEAADLYQQVIAIDPQNMPVRQNLGNCYRRLGHIEVAIREYETVLKAYPHNAETLLNLGVSYMELQLVIKAIETLNMLVEIHPHYRAVGHYYLGRVYHSNDQLNRALEMLKLSVREDPKLIEAHMHLGQVYGELGEHEKAFDSFEKVLKLAPDHVQAKRLRKTTAAMIDEDEEA